MEIVLVTEGELCMTVGSNTYKILKGQGIFVPPFVIHSFSSPKNNHCHVMMFDKELVPCFSGFLKDNRIVSNIFNYSEYNLSIVNKYLPKVNNTIDGIRAQSILAPLCCDVFEHCSFVLENNKNDNLSVAMEYLEKHFTEQITLEQVANSIGIHPVTLSRAFCEKMQTNFNFYLNYMRCAYATSLIKNSDSTFGEIAYAVGFGSIRSFNRCFLKIYGITPTEFKKSSLLPSL